MQTRIRGTSRHCGGGFAKQVAGNVEQGEAPTFLREHLGIRLDENLDGLFAGINLDANGRVAEIDLVSSSVRSANNGVGHCRTRFRGSAATSGRPPSSGPTPSRRFGNYSVERSGRLDQGSCSERPMTT